MCVYNDFFSSRISIKNNSIKLYRKHHENIICAERQTRVPAYTHVNYARAINFKVKVCANAAANNLHAINEKIVYSTYIRCAAQEINVYIYMERNYHKNSINVSRKCNGRRRCAPIELCSRMY